MPHSTIGRGNKYNWLEVDNLRFDGNIIKNTTDNVITFQANNNTLNYMNYGVDASLGANLAYWEMIDQYNLGIMVIKSPAASANIAYYLVEDSIHWGAFGYVKAAEQMQIGCTGEIAFIPNGDTNDYVVLNTVFNVPSFSTSGGCDLGLTSDSGYLQVLGSRTDITGTQLETLSDGSNSDSLHEHTLASGISDTSIITLDYAFDNGKIIDGASSAANSFVVGNGTLTTSFSSYDLGYGLGTTVNINSNTNLVYNIGAAGLASPIMYIAGNNLGGTCNPLVNMISWGSGGIGAGTSYLRYAVGHAADIAYSLTSVSKYQFWLSENITQVMELSTVGTQCQFKFVSSTGMFASTTGAFEFLANGDVDDYLTISTLFNVPTIGTTGACNLDITSSADMSFRTNGNTTEYFNVIDAITLTDVQGVATLDVTIPLIEPIGTSVYGVNPYYDFGLFGIKSAAAAVYSGLAFVEDATNWGAMAWDKSANSVSFISTGIVRMVLANQSSNYVEFGLSSANNIYMKAEGGSNLWLQADAAVILAPNSDADDYISISTVSNIPIISTVGSCDLKIRSSAGNVWIGGDTNYSKFEADGTLEFIGTATVWEDVRIIPGSFDKPGISDPSYVAYDVNGGGTSTYLTEWALNDIASFTLQMPHSYQEGEDVYIHLHWTPGPNGAGENGNTVGWKIQYSWANMDSNFPTMATADLSDACDGTNHKHQMTPEVQITGTGKTISNMLICNITRTDTGADDTWGGTGAGNLPMLLEVDLHFPINTVGSRQKLIK